MLVRFAWGEDVCDALVQFGCYHHREMKVYAYRVLAIPSRVLEEILSVSKR